ncbi:hypothetical protein GF345_05260 [Candidatus Woesearchaeota archaeon]|nr:hypothetical protein [Candidatus Woesearchaeota archaeon]
MRKKEDFIKPKEVNKPEKKKKTKEETSKSGWYFLGICLLIYLIAAVIKPESARDIIDFFLSIIIKIIPIFALIFVLLAAINYFVRPKKLLKYFGREAGAKGYLLSLIAGIISTGPIFMWYPLMNDMQKHGVSNGFLATFLYGRAVKPALLPMMIFYFGLVYTVVLTVVIGLTAIIQGIAVNIIDNQVLRKQIRSQEVEK